MTADTNSNSKTLINSLHLADIHLESNAIDTLDTIKGLWHVLRSVPPEDLDLISFDGDVFDKAMVVPASELGHILLFISSLIDYCLKYNILLRVLEGTPSHDRMQSKLFETLATIKKAEHLVSWKKELEIEYIESLGVHVLYVPDEINHDNEDTLIQAQQLLKKWGLEKVDFISMHGAFKYQIGNILSRPHHLEEPWMALCKYFINIGHVHGHSTYGGTILVTGSLNRTSHNEERSKGAILTTVDTEKGTKSWKFIENIYATLFVTADVRGLTIHETLDKVKALNLPKGSRVRLLNEPGDETLLAFARIRQEFPQYSIARKLVKKEEVKVDIDKVQMIAKGVSLTFNNVAKLTEEYAKENALEWHTDDGKALAAIIEEVA